MKFTYWRIDSPITTADYHWLKDIGCDIELHEPQTLELPSFGGTTVNRVVVAKGYVTVRTASDKVNSLIRLRFADIDMLVEEMVWT